MVTPQNWLFLKTYKDLREYLLHNSKWECVARLGTNAFRDMNWWAATTSLIVISKSNPLEPHNLCGMDVGSDKSQVAKADMLKGIIPTTPCFVNQLEQLLNPGIRIVFQSTLTGMRRLDEYVAATQGISPGDTARMRSCFWETIGASKDWVLLQSTPTGTSLYDGLKYAVVNPLSDKYNELPGFRLCGDRAWGKMGICVGKMSTLPASVYLGGVFDANAPVLCAKENIDIGPIVAFVQSESYSSGIRELDQKSDAAVNVIDKVHFNVDEWTTVFRSKYFSGLPEPESDDPTQWLFHGWPSESTSPLQVAVARLLGYRWPAELDPEMRLSERARQLVARCSELDPLIDDDGIVCIPSVRGEEAAADRLTRLLAKVEEASSLLSPWVQSLEGSATLDDWLRNRFFKEHCETFDNVPFIWHIYDGRKEDGFHALVNYHKLAGPDGRKVLENLTYSYLGEWIDRQKDEVRRELPAAEARLLAAEDLFKRLEAILEGEPPYDIFVRWKPLHEQPFGWHPDINDGVRMNIRPFLASDLPGVPKGAGVLRIKPKSLKWTKDRGKEPERDKQDYPWFWGNVDAASSRVDYDGNAGVKSQDGSSTFTGIRWNDCHYTRAAKQAARDAVKIHEPTALAAGLGEPDDQGPQRVPSDRNTRKQS